MTVGKSVFHRFYAEIIFKLRVSPYTTTTRRFATVPLQTDDLYSGSVKAFGILRAISGLGQTVGETLPINRTGAIVLDNTRGSIGSDTRFSDYLEDEEIVDQSIEIKSHLSPPETSSSSGDLKTEFKGVVRGVNVDNVSNLITLEIEQTYIKPDVLQTFVDDDVFTDSPDRSLGRYLPLAFGS